MGDTKHALSCSYCELGFKPMLFFSGWRHPSIKEEEKRDGQELLIVCINHHPEFADNWKKRQITSSDFVKWEDTLKKLAQSL